MKQTDPVDDDLEGMTREQLIAEVIKLRTAIRDHRDASGHDLCWHHPDLWRTLPERVEPTSRSRRGRSSCVDASRTANRLMSKHSRPNPTTQSMTSIPQADPLTTTRSRRPAVHYAIEIVAASRSARAGLESCRALSAHERGEHAIAELDLLRNAEGGVPEDPLVQLARLTRAAAAMCEGKVVKHKQVARLISHTRPPGR